MIPYAYITGTFYDASGVVRANETITFIPLSTPYAIDGELVLSIPQTVVLNSNGKLHDGLGTLHYRLTKGMYRVVVTDTDAFFISVPDDGLDHPIDSVAIEVNGSPSQVKRALSARDVFDASLDSTTFRRTLRGDLNEFPDKFLIIGETGDLSDDINADIETFPGIAQSAYAANVVVLGNGNPGGASGTIGNALTVPWGPFISQNRFWYALGNDDWIPGNVNAVTTFLPSHASRYFKVVLNNLVGNPSSVALFILDSNDLEPDSNSSSGTQAIWLRNALAAATERWKIVCFRDSPFVSVAGKSKAAMNWPFAAWGANAVFAAGAKVMEHLTLSSTVPLVVTGCGDNAGFDVFTTPLSNSVFRVSGGRFAVLVCATAAQLQIEFLRLSDGESVYRLIVPGADSNRLSFSSSVQSLGGIRSTVSGLGLDDVGLATVSEFGSVGMQNIISATRGAIVSLTAKPTLAEVSANPWLKNCLIAVGTDPTRFWWWNKPKQDFVPLTADAYSGVSEFNGSRPVLASPVFRSDNHGIGQSYGQGATVSGFVSGVFITHDDPTVAIWVDHNGNGFALNSAWPGLSQVYLENPLPGKAYMIATYARKAGFQDSPVRYIILNSFV